ncbi:Molybdopterin synthase catalytic subunit [Candidatus Thermoflexus japonica]|uniref:Molybdopterin synthase catalytic subunit n=1 Tax=Candidatus Thermoflexus japonica TaxID=2035417 RepID=A0A2H5Y7C2_9CHLR|nr:Molybdopterin synthase catalytic subunit [Candidatus Thermoflexus japonica]
MEVQIRLFATLKDRAGREQISVQLRDGASVADLLKAVGETYPALQPYLSSAVVAINHEFAFPEDRLRPGDEVALFPPVSGGDGDPLRPELVALTAEPIDLNALVQAVVTPRSGAVAFFTGVVRGEEGDRRVEFLEYEAYQPMAEAKMRQIVAEIRERWPLIHGIALVQRVGRMEVGEITVAVVVSAGHRHEGVFEAARYGIDRLKEIVPVWKKEIGSHGEVWIEGHYHPSPADVSP